MVFVGILVVGLAYVWKKGDLEWIKKVEYEREPEGSTAEAAKL